MSTWLHCSALEALRQVYKLELCIGSIIYAGDTVISNQESVVYDVIVIVLWVPFSFRFHYKVYVANKYWGHSLQSLVTGAAVNANVQSVTPTCKVS